MLVPYKVSKNSLSQIEDTYKLLAEENRLVIPGQVAREFANNRPFKLGEIHQALSIKRSVKQLTINQYPLLEEVPGYSEFQRLEKEINKLIADYRKVIKDITSHMIDWNWTDPISRLYSNIFPPLVVDIALDEKDVRTQLEYQVTNKIPPGYKDASKPDKGVGDYLIWQVVLKVAEERKCPIVFVSSDSKADWFYRSDKQRLYPRFELVDQIRRKTEGKSFHIIQFSDFLELFDATADTVSEIRNEEVKIDLANMNRHAQVASKNHLVEDAVAQIINEKLTPEARAILRQIADGNLHLTLQQYNAINKTELSVFFRELTDENLITPLQSAQKERVYWLSPIIKSAIKDVLSTSQDDESVIILVREILENIGYHNRR